MRGETGSGVVAVDDGGARGWGVGECMIMAVVVCKSGLVLYELARVEVGVLDAMGEVVGKWCDGRSVWIWYEVWVRI